jgi:cytochrome c-type biogenesis protein CcmH/NrfG
MTIRTAVSIFLAIVAVIPAQTPDEWKMWIRRGVESYKLGQYQLSAIAFQHAVDLNPNDPVPHIYLGIAWHAQFVPGAQDTTVEYQSLAQYRRAIELDADNWPALVLLGQLARDQGNFDEARSWFEKALRLDPSGADTWAAIGALAWRPSRGPAAPQVIDQGISDLQHAVVLDPHHQFAMMFLDALYRNRGDIMAADKWRQRAEEEQSERLRRGAGNPVIRWPAPLSGTYQIIRDMASAAVQPLPPLPPPPPPQPRRPGDIVNRAGPANGWNFRHIPSPDGQPPPLLVNPVAQGRSLVRKIDPIYSSTPTGTFRIGVIIGKDGHVRSATLLEGDPVLGTAALNAVRQWVYRPTLSNWEPVEVRSEVRLEPGPVR